MWPNFNYIDTILILEIHYQPSIYQYAFRNTTISGTEF